MVRNGILVNAEAHEVSGPDKNDAGSPTGEEEEVARVQATILSDKQNGLEKKMKDLISLLNEPYPELLSEIKVNTKINTLNLEEHLQLFQTRRTCIKGAPSFEKTRYGRKYFEKENNKIQAAYIIEPEKYIRHIPDLHRVEDVKITMRKHFDEYISKFEDFNYRPCLIPLCFSGMGNLTELQKIFASHIGAYMISKSQYLVVTEDPGSNEAKCIIRDTNDKLATCDFPNSNICKLFSQDNMKKWHLWDIYAFIKGFDFSMRHLTRCLFDTFLNAYEINLHPGLITSKIKTNLEELRDISRKKYPREATNALSENVLEQIVNPFKKFMNFMFECKQSHNFTVFKAKRFKFEYYKVSFMDKKLSSMEVSLMIKTKMGKLKYSSRDFILILYGTFGEFDTSKIVFAKKESFKGKDQLTGLLFILKHESFLILYFTYHKLKKSNFPGNDSFNAMFMSTNPMSFLGSPGENTYKILFSVLMGVNTCKGDGSAYGNPYSNLHFHGSKYRIYYIFLFYRLLIRLSHDTISPMGTIVENLINEKHLLVDDIGKEFLLDALKVLQSSDNLLVFKTSIEAHGIPYHPLLLFEPRLSRLDYINSRMTQQPMRTPRNTIIRLEAMQENLSKHTPEQDEVFLPMMKWIMNINADVPEDRKFFLMLCGPTGIGKSYFANYLRHIGFTYNCLPIQCGNLIYGQGIQDVDFVFIDEVRGDTIIRNLSFLNSLANIGAAIRLKLERGHLVLLNPVHVLFATNYCPECIINENTIQRDNLAAILAGFWERTIQVSFGKHDCKTGQWSDYDGLEITPNLIPILDAPLSVKGEPLTFIGLTLVQIEKIKNHKRKGRKIDRASDMKLGFKCKYFLLPNYILKLEQTGSSITYTATMYSLDYIHNYGKLCEKFDGQPIIPTGDNSNLNYNTSEVLYYYSPDVFSVLRFPSISISYTLIIDKNKKNSQPEFKLTRVTHEKVSLDAMLTLKNLRDYIPTANDPPILNQCSLSLIFCLFVPYIQFGIASCEHQKKNSIYPVLCIPGQDRIFCIECIGFMLQDHGTPIHAVIYDEVYTLFKAAVARLWPR